MGAGASNFEPSMANQGGGGGGGGGVTRFLCHACQNVFSESDLNNNAGLSRDERACPACNSTFIEEVVTTVQRNSDSFLAQQDLSEDQMRRVANATLMLRLLDAQLRQELDMFQRLYNASLVEAQQQLEKQQKMTETMHDKLRYTTVDMDMLCTLPSCPICCEEYVIKTDISRTDKEKEVVQLPCKHFFHPHCVIPWLDVKKTCPICRAEMTNDVPSINELMRFNESEIIEKLNGYNKECSRSNNNVSVNCDKDYSKMEKTELANIFRNYISKRKEKNEEMEPSSNDHRRSNIEEALSELQPLPSLVSTSLNILDRNVNSSSSNSNSNSLIRNSNTSINSNIHSNSNSNSNTGLVSQMGLLEVMQREQRERMRVDDDDRSLASAQERQFRAMGALESPEDRQYRAFYDMISLDRDRGGRFHDDSDDGNDSDDDSDNSSRGELRSGIVMRGDPRLSGGTNIESSSHSSFHSTSNSYSSHPSSSASITASATPTTHLNSNNPSSANTLRVHTLPWMRAQGAQTGRNITPIVTPTSTPDETASDIVERLVHNHMDRTGLNYLGNNLGVGPSITTYIVRSSNNGVTMSMTPIINRVVHPN